MRSVSVYTGVTQCGILAAWKQHQPIQESWFPCGNYQPRRLAV